MYVYPAATSQKAVPELKLDAPKNANYAATIVRLHTVVDLSGLDNLVGVPVLGHQALTTRDAEVGQLRVVFTAETQLSEQYALLNNLYRQSDLNWDQGQKGYLENNRRVKALRMRGHVSNALLMPLSSLAYTGADLSQLKDGDSFDTLNGHEVCRKYVVKQKHGQNPAKSKVEKAFKRVDAKLFPEHLETDQYWRNKHLLKNDREVVVTQKLHGTSWRGGNVPVKRQKKWHEKLLNKVFKTPDYEYAVVFGSRKVIKDPNNPRQNHFYDNDIWTEYGQKVGDLIPEGYIVYGELVGWTPPPTTGHNQEFIDKVPENKRVEVLGAKPIQKNYTYHLAEGECELYVYRVAFINNQGVLTDLSWDGVRQFCVNRGLKVTPELFRFSGDWHKPWDDRDLECQINGIMDQRYADTHPNCAAKDDPLPLSDKKSVDEGVCLRQEGLNPVILKAKSPKFLEHETKLLDKDEVDMESAA